MSRIPCVPSLCHHYLQGAGKELAEQRETLQEGKLRLKQLPGLCWLENALGGGSGA